MKRKARLARGKLSTVTMARIDNTKPRAVVALCGMRSALHEGVHQ